jgi:Hint domain
MAINTWIGPTKGTANIWLDPTNWNGGVPVISSDVAISAAGTYTVLINPADRPYQIKSLRLGNASGIIRLVENGSLSVIGSATLTHSIFDIGAGATGSVFGNLSLDAGSIAQTEGVFDIAGSLTGSGGKVLVDGGSLFAGTVSGSNNYVLTLDGAFEVAGGFAATSTITFGDDLGESLVLDHAGTTLNATIAGFGGGNEIDIGSLAFSTQYTTHYSGTTLTISLGANTVFTITNINNPGSFALAEDGSDGTMVTVCFARGTMLRTPDSDVPVESLKPGHEVMTVSGDALVPVRVKWVGIRHVNLAAHPRPLLVAPVLIERGAFAADVPQRDLLVSPDHAILADGTLICARQLLNGTTIRQDTDRRSVVYYHVELETHSIMLAEGLPVESYLDTGNRGFFANADLPCPLHPDLTGEVDNLTREANSCVPFATDEAAIHKVWQRLAERAATIGRRPAQPQTTDDSDLRLLVGGRLIRPVIAGDRLSTFPLPPGTTEVRLVSRAAAPSDARPWLDDRRRLGVRVARLVLRSHDELHEIPLDHPDLATGWWAVERDGTALGRWTDGDAVLPLPATSGASMLEVRVAGTVTYLTAAEMARAA